MSPVGRTPVYLIHGNQRLLVEEELTKLRSAMAEKVDPEFNLDVFEAGEDPLERALQSAETVPLAADRRYVIVKEAQRLTPSELKQLSGYLENPAESALLVLAAVDIKPGSSLLRMVEKAGRVKEVARTRSQIPGWVRERFKKKGLKVSGKALAYLQEALGDDLMAIENAVEKVAAYHEGEGEVDLDEVLALVSPSAESPAFEYVDRVAAGDTEMAVKLMRRLLEQGERPASLLNALSRRFRELLLYHALREEGRQEGEIAASMSLPPNRAWMVSRKLKPQSVGLEEKDFLAILSLLLDAEWGMKSGRWEDEYALERATAGAAGLVAAGKRRRPAPRAR
ncbi:MAG: DNA polymerase III subunit delta [Actinobacteria bacterium]|nr:DNA polymerase III subunit delta [Actinomycetota bacterium]